MSFVTKGEVVYSIAKNKRRVGTTKSIDIYLYRNKRLYKHRIVYKEYRNLHLNVIFNGDISSNNPLLNYANCYDSLFPIYVICSLECKSIKDIEISSSFIFTISAVSEIGILMKLIVCDEFTGKLT